MAVPLLSACNQSHQNDATQVVAKVDGVEITVHQLNYLMAKLSAEGKTPNKKDVLDDLINQQLLINQAIKNKVDQDPNVLMQVEMSKRQIYSQDSIARIVKGVSAPELADVKKYYEQHAEQFSNRTKYKFHAFLFSNVKNFDSFSADLEKSTTIEQTQKVLADAAVKFDERDIEVSTELLPSEMLAQLTKMKVGDIKVIRTQAGYELDQLMSRQITPLDFAQSIDLIKSKIGAERVREKIDTELKDYRKQAKIEYVDSSATVGK
ncbi:EpsD family peptidyl-prolyl cis-trans isomerase [Aquitalea sp. LB_tupeE]|uniref:EpsD family peptidyl-prolyl cis-trans isomerase n=1 Tax=Aquitalea sp. LB_tupeE TaxID=2748078 RepID=UPI0015BB1D10|nr:EpsD family peptidyl-prolyl cis-trans isomerase [Aquitalea sp. LB_tupeE]NWK79430.1 peptidyl-prolyl cis-trans isomerase, EpsD family [Aquitalea sp. LB_tupeE]